MKLFCFICLLLLFAKLPAQTVGGSSTYNFLKLPATPLLTAAGGVNTSYAVKEVGFANNNPALLNPDLHAQLSASFNAFFKGVSAYNLAGAYYYQPAQTTFSGNIFFINYGQITQTDAAGNIGGDFRPVDYAVQLSAARQYLERWQYGLSIKFIHSAYPPYTSSALAFDAGVFYKDTAHYFSASIVAKNMGGQIKTYAGSGEDLPFDLEAGFTKKLQKAPLAFSVTAHHLHQFDLAYNDTAFNRENNLSHHPSIFNKLFNHLVAASHIYLSNNLEVIMGYNYLRRTELNAGSSGNGLNGFSAGFNASFRKLGFQYARAYYQSNVAYNQFALLLHLNQLFGLGNP